MIASSVSSSIQ